MLGSLIFFVLLTVTGLLPTVLTGIGDLLNAIFGGLIPPMM